MPRKTPRVLPPLPPRQSGSYPRTAQSDKHIQNALKARKACLLNNYSFMLQAGANASLIQELIRDKYSKPRLEMHLTALEEAVKKFKANHMGATSQLAKNLNDLEAQRTEILESLIKSTEQLLSLERFGQRFKSK